MLRFFRAYMRNGRLVLDEPADFPEGALVDLVSADEILSNGGDLLDADERAALHRELKASIAEADAGLTFNFAEVLAELRARHTQQKASRPAVETTATRTSMQPLSAHVQNRRLVLDEPTELPDGTVVKLVSLDDVLTSGDGLLDDEEQAALDRELEASFAEEEAGQLLDLADAIADLKSDGER